MEIRILILHIYNHELIPNRNFSNKAILFPPLNHNNMVPETSLNLSIFRIGSCARLEIISRLLESGIETTADFPAKGTTCDRG